MRIAICDDLKIDREQITKALKDIDGEFFVNEFDDGHELLKSHALSPYDLIILDILMPKISGIDTAAHLRETDTETPVIFISTSEEFGVMSYRVLAFDYLLKPIDKNLLEKSLKRLNQKNSKKDFVSVTYSGAETKILLSNIQCLESNLRKVIFTLSEGKEIEIVSKLADYENFLISHGFCRCHKSYIVNIKHIDSIDGDTFHLMCGKAVKISRAFQKSAKKAYFDYIFGTEAE